MSDFLRFAVVLLGGFAGLCFGGVGWFLAGRWWTGRRAEAHPSCGKMDPPSDQVIDATMVTLLGTPIAAVAGAFAGVGLAIWLARRWDWDRTNKLT
jgi:hypothetical protein